MIFHSSLPLAEYHEPLFGNQWLALIAILVGVALLMIVVAAVGRWLAATHPDAPPKTSALKSDVPTVEGTSPETLAVIAAAVAAAAIGGPARIASVRAITATPSVEMLMQQWSIEGRRQIYSSHQIR